VRFSGERGVRTPDYRGPFTLPLNVARKTSGKVRQFGETSSLLKKKSTYVSVSA